jgi:CspA family cold shock protein
VTPVFGTIKWFSAERGFGFVAPDDGGGEDVFVHASTAALAGLKLHVGDRLRYEIELSATGRTPRAVKLARTSSPSFSMASRG